MSDEEDHCITRLITDSVRLSLQLLGLKLTFRGWRGAVVGSGEGAVRAIS